MKQIYLAVLTSIFLFNACSTGQKRLDRGDYDTAVFKAVKRLQQNPKNKKAANVLREAYTHAVNDHMSRVEYLDASNDAFKYDQMVEEYRTVRYLNDVILGYPKYSKLVELVNVDSEIAFTEKQAAQAHFAEGMEFMDLNTKAHARQAHFHFGRSIYFTPANKEMVNMYHESLEAGTENVGVEFADDNRFFRDFQTERLYDNMFNGLTNLNYKFLRVVGSNDTRFDLDRILQIELEDAHIGRVDINRNVSSVSKDDVYMGESESDSGEVFKVYGTVTADYIQMKKTVNSRASILIQEIDAVSGVILNRRIIPNSYCWTEEWANYRGDKRALSQGQLNMAQKAEPRRPDHNWIFAQTSAPLAGEACNYLRNQFNHLR